MTQAKFMTTELRNHINIKLANINFNNNYNHNKKQIDEVNSLVKFINQFITIARKSKKDKR